MFNVKMREWRARVCLYSIDWAINGKQQQPAAAAATVRNKRYAQKHECGRKGWKAKSETEKERARDRELANE